MKYLVTGVAGFIASKVVELLLEQEHAVIGIDNLNAYYDVRLKQHRLKQLERNNNFSFLKVDIENLREVEAIFSRNTFQAVFNLAARAGVRYSMENPHVYMTTNANGTLNILECMRQVGCSKMVLASTSSLYAGQPMPFSENLAVNTPISPYAASKKAAEVMAYSYHHLFDLDITVVRYFTVYGPCGRPDMSVFRFIKWIDEGHPIEVFGDGTQSRDFTYVDDIAAGTILAKKRLAYEILNLGGGRNPVSLKSIISSIEQCLGKRATINYQPFHKADMKETYADISKAARLLNWKPKITVEQGIEKTIKWYIDNREWLKDVKL
jgi:UDP-glucuronate 4-epimerase